MHVYYIGYRLQSVSVWIYKYARQCRQFSQHAQQFMVERQHMYMSMHAWMYVHVVHVTCMLS